MTTERPFRKQSAGLFSGRGRLRRVQLGEPKETDTLWCPFSFAFDYTTSWTRKAEKENKVNPCFPAVARRASPLASHDRLGFLLFKQNHSCSFAASVGSQKEEQVK